MAFPPNYNQDRTNRARAKARKALDKQSKREEKAAQRKHDQPATEQGSAAVADKEEQP